MTVGAQGEKVAVAPAVPTPGGPGSSAGWSWCPVSVGDNEKAEAEAGPTAHISQARNAATANAHSEFLEQSCRHTGALASQRSCWDPTEGGNKGTGRT